MLSDALRIGPNRIKETLRHLSIRYELETDGYTKDYIFKFKDGFTCRLFDLGTYGFELVQIFPESVLYGSAIVKYIEKEITSSE